MSIPSPDQLDAVTALATFALVMSVASFVSIGVFIGVGAVPLFLLGAWLSPSRGRIALAALGVCWGLFCVVVLAVAWTM